MFRKASKTLLIITATTTLSGCMVSPEPIKNNEHSTRAWNDLQALYQGVEPLEGPLTLSEAISRGLLYNFDFKMGVLEEILQGNQLTLANFNMLPRLAANAGYRYRDDERAVTSISLESRRESLEPSFSEERVGYYADLGASWNLLDFGLSYYQAKQQSDRVLAAVERRRRVMNNMVKEIQTSYWRAVTAQQLLPQVETLITDVEQALAASRKIEQEKLQAPMKTLEYQRTLLRVMAQLKQLRGNLSIAKSELRSLINLPPTENFTLSTEGNLESIPVITSDIKTLQSYSLIYRPELREEAYQERIDRQNITKEILNAFPGVTLLAGTNYDSNRFLTFQNWQNLGAKATWNLISVLQAPTAIKGAKTQVEISKIRRLAVSAAVLSQVAISYNQYEQSVESYQTAQDISDIEARMLQISQNAGQANTGTRLDQIQRTAQSLAAQLERGNAMAGAMEAYANLAVSVGIDLIPPAAHTTSLTEMNDIVQSSLYVMQNNGMDRLVRRAALDLETESAMDTVVEYKAPEPPAKITTDFPPHKPKTPEKYLK